MSKSVNFSIFMLLFILAGTLLYSGYTVMEKQKIEIEKVKLEEQVAQSQDREKGKVEEIQRLKERIAQFDDERSRLEKKVSKAEDKMASLFSDSNEAEADRDKYKRKLNNSEEEISDLKKKIKSLNNDQDDLMVKLKRARSAQQDAEELASRIPTTSTPSRAVQPAAVSAAPVSYASSGNNDAYFADIIKEKAALETEVKQLRNEVATKDQSILELRDKNETLKFELGSLKFSTDEVAREIQYKEDMINNLSLQLAREKNNKKFSSDRLTTLHDENVGLREELKRLSVSKFTLEKTIAKVKQEKDQIEAQLIERENLIQGKIDEIWEIKESLDKTFKSTKLSAPEAEIELPPILVSTQGHRAAVNFNPNEAPSGYNGKIVNVNTENNFAIVNLGEGSGVKLGTELSVYRKDGFIARLKVIQLRKDISAADIVEQKQTIQIGDIVR